jgi:hypothetical protein
METSLNSFRNHCLETTLDVLWRQWCSLGVAGHARAAEQGHLIDLEALVLITASIGRHDPRLFDEALDWLASFGSLINLQRLANLQHAHRLADDLVLLAMADWLAKKAGQPRWKAIVRGKEERNPNSAPEPLFPDIKGPEPAEPDPVFLTRNLVRNIFQPRGMSRAPHPHQPPNLMASLRALIGVSARVEIILFLAGSRAAAKATDIARATGYAPRTLQAVLREMLLSGQILTQESPRDIGRRTQPRYHLKASDWTFLTAGAPLPQWTPWAALFALARSVLAAVPSPSEKPRHSAVISSRLRDTLADYGPAMAAAGLLPDLDIRPDASGTELLETLAEGLPALIAKL